jgi:hypothetical protein
MAHLHLEIGDFADLVRDIANRRQPLFSEKYTYGVWPLRGSLDVTVQEVESIRADGPILIDSTLNAGEMEVLVGVQIPKLYVRLACVVRGGGVLIKDGARTLEIGIDGGATGRARFTATDDGGIELETVHIDLLGFGIRFHVLPAWMERRLQKPIEKALEDALENLVRRAFPADLLEELDLPGPPSDASRTAETRRETRPDGHEHLHPLSRATYSGAYYLSYGITFALLFLPGTILCPSAAVRGLRDGAASAVRSVRRIRDDRDATDSPGAAPANGSSKRSAARDAVPSGNGREDR